MSILLTPKQLVAVEYLNDQVTNEILFGGGAGSGKSALGCLWIIQRAINYPETRWLIGRSRLKTLKETTLKSFFDIARKLGFKQGVGWKLNHQTNTIHLYNGSEILLKDLFAYPSDPEFEELGSLELTGAFIDECSQVTKKAKDMTKSRIRYKLDENGLVPKLLLTCNPAKNWTYQDFYKPHRDNELKESRIFIPALLSDNPHISKHYRENLLSLDPISMDRLLNGNWEYDDSPNKLINFDAIIDLFTNTHVKGAKNEDEDKNEEGYITADVARMGSDKAVIIRWKGFAVKEIIVFDISKLTEIRDGIDDMKNKHGIRNSHIIVDEDGVGGGLVDFGDYVGFVNGSKALEGENYMNLKSQCYYKLAEKVNAAEIYVEPKRYKEEIVEELEWVRSYKTDSDGKLRVLPKEMIREMIGKSPDFADSIMMRVYFELRPNYGKYHVR